MAVLLLELQLASVVFHDLSGNAESQSDAFAHVFGGEKWLHDLGLQLRRDPGPAIGHGKLDGIITHHGG